MATETTRYRCGCGAWTGVACEWAGPLSEMAVVEYMPEYLRASHEAAGNPGVYPHNGASRIAAELSCALDLIDSEGDSGWAAIVAADAGHYAEPAHEG